MQSPVIALLGMVWGAGVVVGCLLLAAYAGGDEGALSARSVWPCESRLRRDSEGAAPVMFVQPPSPCTRASLRELGRRVNAPLGAPVLACPRFTHLSLNGVR